MRMRIAAFSLLSFVLQTGHAGAVVTAADSPIASMDKDQAKRVFMGHEPQVSGVNLLVLYQKNEAVAGDFETKVLGKTGDDLAAYWSKLVFTGKAAAPVDVADDTAVKSKIASSHNAIGYVSDAGIDGTVKVLFKY